MRIPAVALTLPLLLLTVSTVKADLYVYDFDSIPIVSTNQPPQSGAWDYGGGVGTGISSTTGQSTINGQDNWQILDSKYGRSFGNRPVTVYGGVASSVSGFDLSGNFIGPYQWNGDESSYRLNDANFSYELTNQFQMKFDLYAGGTTQFQTPANYFGLTSDRAGDGIDIDNPTDGNNRYSPDVMFNVGTAGGQWRIQLGSRLNGDGLTHYTAGSHDINTTYEVFLDVDLTDGIWGDDGTATLSYREKGSTADPTIVHDQVNLFLTDAVNGAPALDEYDGIAVRTGLFSYLDNLQIETFATAVPEPGSVAVWGLLGIAGLIYSRRRRCATSNL